jgi:hypothetical protein
MHIRITKTIRFMLKEKISIYDCHFFLTISMIESCTPILSKMEFNIIPIISSRVNIDRIVISIMESRKYGTYFPPLNKYESSLNLLLDYQILFFIIQICGRNEKKQTVRYIALLSMIRGVNT